MKLATIIGARPQFVKAAIVSHAFKQSNLIEEIVIHTGQHFDDNMSDVFFSELDMEKPKYNLGIGGGLHGAMTGAQIEAIEVILLEEKPDFAIVYGDTNSTLAGALAASKLHIPIAHVEAGLRSFNRKMPEEINRIVTDRVSDVLFAPTSVAMKNLSNEGVPKSFCYQVGDVMLDAAIFYGEKAKKLSNILSHLNLENSKFILTTIHRAENTNDPERLKRILSALRIVSESVTVVLPLHPRTRQLMKLYNLDTVLGDKVYVIDPVGYLDMVMLEQNAAVIVTDSGGVQKEAFFYKVPCVILRDETEWLELVDAGWNRVVPPNDIQIMSDFILKAIDSHGKPITPYGEGNAAQSIMTALLNYK